MTDNIEVKVTQIDQALKDLNSLKNKLNRENKKAPTIKGGGESATELQELGELYPKLYQQMCEMVQYSVQFLSKASQDFINDDKTAAAKLNT